MSDNDHGHKGCRQKLLGGFFPLRGYPPFTGKTSCQKTLSGNGGHPRPLFSVKSPKIFPKSMGQKGLTKICVLFAKNSSVRIFSLAPPWGGEPTSQHPLYNCNMPSSGSLGKLDIIPNISIKISINNLLSPMQCHIPILL